MFRLFGSLLFAGAVIACMTAGTPDAKAQTSGAHNAVAKKTFLESARQKREQLEQQESRKRARIKTKLDADSRAARVAHRKRVVCGKRAKERHLHLLKRRRFIKKCMAAL
jgi:hypothetical protein